MTVHKRIGVFGTPCGGTSFVWNCLVSAHLRVGHEQMKRDGIVCGWWARNETPDNEHRVGQQFTFPGDYSFDVIVHLVRDPVATSCTLARTASKETAPWAHHDLRLNAMRTWVATHQAILRWRPRIGDCQWMTVRLDSFAEDSLPMYTALGVDPVLDGERYSKRQVNAFPAVEWEEWKVRDPEYYRAGKRLWLQLVTKEKEDGQ